MDTHLDLEKARQAIVDFIKEYAARVPGNGAVIGISGGIDSALTSYLTVEALGAQNVLGLHIPELNVTSAEDVLDATMVADSLGIKLKTIDISGLVREYEHIIPDSKDTTAHVTGNLKARIRMTILYYYANLLNRVVMGTGNRTEFLLGYFTKYGDGGVDLEPIGDLFKTEVRKMSALVGVPEGIIDKPPSAGLRVGQTDEDDLGMAYEDIDRVLGLLLEGETPQYVQDLMGIPVEHTNALLIRIRNNLHKRNTPPIPCMEELR